MQKKIFMVARLEDGGIIFATDDFKKIFPVIEKELEELENYFSDVYYPTLKEQQALENWAKLNFPRCEQTLYGENFIIARVICE